LEAAGERLVSDGSFLDGVDARKGRWRLAATEAKGISAEGFWTGRGRDALEVAYAAAATKPNATEVREVWKQRHGRAAAPLLLVVAYPRERPQRATLCGPAGMTRRWSTSTTIMPSRGSGLLAMRDGGRGSASKRMILPTPYP
jgi:hypothetical protein